MPFQSKAQAGYMFANHPDMAKEWAAATPDMKSLPEHKKKKKKKSMKEMIVDKLGGHGD